MSDLLETAIRRREGMRAEMERLERFIRVGEEMLSAAKRGDRPAMPVREAAAATANFFTEA